MRLIFFSPAYVPTVLANVPVMSVPLFEACALPLHVNLTPTPIVIEEENGPDAPADLNLLCALALQRSTFTAGSYG